MIRAGHGGETCLEKPSKPAKNIQNGVHFGASSRTRFWKPTSKPSWDSPGPYKKTFLLQALGRSLFMFEVPTWGPKFQFVVEQQLKRPSGRLQAGFFCASKDCLRIQPSWRPFGINFWRILRCPGEAKTRFSLESGTNLSIFGNLNMGTLLDSRKPRFWVRFGCFLGLLDII